MTCRQRPAARQRIDDRCRQCGLPTACDRV